MPEDVVEYIKTGVENAGSFPKFVDALVAEHMNAGKEIDGSAAASLTAVPGVPAKVDLSGLEQKVDEARKDILAAILHQVSIEPKMEVEPVAVQQQQPAAAAPVQHDISRNDLVSLRRAVASDIVKAKDEEIEKLDELLSAIETMKIQLKEMSSKPAASEKEVVESESVVLESRPASYADKISAAVEKAFTPIFGGKEEDEDEITADDLESLPFDDDDFAHGIGDLIGIDYVAQVEAEEKAAVPEDVLDDEDVEYEEDEDDDDVYEYDDETLMGAQVLLGMA